MSPSQPTGPRPPRPARAPSRGLPLSLSLSLLVLLSAGRARAQALTAPNVGTSASGPAVADPAAVHWNPGMLGFLEGPQLLVGAGLIVGDVSYERNRRATYQRADSLSFSLPVSPAAIDAGKSGKAPVARATPVAPLASLFASLPLGNRLTAGLGVYAPYAAALKFEPDGAQRFALQDATIAALYVTPAISWRPIDELSIGVGASYVLGFAQLSKIQDFAALDDVGTALARPPISQRNGFGQSADPAVRELNVMARPIQLKNAIAHSFTFNAGAALRPAPGTTLGLTYQHSVPMTFNGKFTLDMNDDFFTQDLATQGLAYKPKIEGDATLKFTLPRAVILGAAQELTDAFSLALMLQYTWWSQVQAFDVAVQSPDLAQPKLGLPDTSAISLPRRWRNTIAAELTGLFKASKVVALWLVGGYRSAASPDATIDAASPDGDRIVGAVGGSYALSEKVTALADFKAQVMLPRTVEASELDLGNGTYNLRIYALTGYLKVGFLGCSDFQIGGGAVEGAEGAEGKRPLASGALPLHPGGALPLHPGQEKRG
jgi:long-chain fatty acid transport protein